MVLQLALPSGELPRFYGFLMDEKQEAKKTGSKVLSSKELFGNEKLVLIEHEGGMYRLMVTKQGKLILNK